MTSQRTGPTGGTGVDRAGPAISSPARGWAATMEGHRHVTTGEGLRIAHGAPAPPLGRTPQQGRVAREEWEDATLAPGATRARGAGRRARPEEPDPERTCFERDRDRIVHATAFRRLAGKTQVFVHPEDHQRTRLTHALEVAQVATAIARSVGANVALVEAIALGHDCGHGPGGHASEEAFSPYVAGGYDHAVWGADVVLAPLNLCTETLDGIRNHSWSRPTPTTPEGEIVSWADRIAYVCHDFEDAVHVGITSADLLPPVVRARCGERRSRQLHAFIDAVVDTVRSTGQIGMRDDLAEALAEFRRFNYEHIYMRPASVRQSRAVVRVLRALVEYHADRPNSIHRPTARAGVDPGSPEAFREAVTYVGGMTDRFAFAQARALLGWRSTDLPVGIG
jgi:dGTPase